ncbi:hypothetical protein TNCV_5139581 [Trichonephila clavipes]|nr:hypothetical protein TNCV_5139581 [Trichonephila clavipes]
MKQKQQTINKHSGPSSRSSDFPGRAARRVTFVRSRIAGGYRLEYKTTNLSNLIWAPHFRSWSTETFLTNAFAVVRLPTVQEFHL